MLSISTPELQQTQNKAGFAKQGTCGGGGGGGGVSLGICDRKGIGSPQDSSTKLANAHGTAFSKNGAGGGPIPDEEV